MVEHDRVTVGRCGEDYAFSHLEQQGLRVLERNYRSGKGEIDLVAKDGDTYVFVEVKTNIAGMYGDPEERVGKRKQQQVARIARNYVAEHGLERENARFDVISVKLSSKLALVHLEHFRDAFWAARY